MGLVARYRQDHRNPVNHFLHVGVGWPMVAAAVLLVPFRPLWSLALVVAAYAIMFFGHFVFERNIAHDPQAPEHAVRRRLVGDPRALRRIGPPGDAPARPLNWKGSTPRTG